MDTDRVPDWHFRRGGPPEVRAHANRLNEQRPSRSGIPCETAGDERGHLAGSGLVELQFLTDDRGDRHLIDFNGRFYGSMALANAARPGLADAWGRRVIGEPVAPLPDGAPGVRFTWLAADLRRAVTERRGGLIHDVGATLRWGARAHRSVWDVHDVGPTVALATARLRPTAGPPLR